MRFSSLHSWDVDTRGAAALQEKLRTKIDSRSSLKDVEWVAGADVSYIKETNRIYGAVVLFRLPELDVVENVFCAGEAQFPYVPGLLSFREAPILLQAFKKLKRRPQAVIFDGQGIAHPRRFGLASHLGLWLDLPSVGCAKTRLIGEHREPPDRVGASAPLVDAGETIGSVLRTRKGVKPVFISVGHRINLKSAIRLIMACRTRYRLPEPTRMAHQLVKKAALSDS